jgi:hypothetical protein
MFLMPSLLLFPSLGFPDDGFGYRPLHYSFFLDPFTPPLFEKRCFGFFSNGEYSNLPYHTSCFRFFFVIV